MRMPRLIALGLLAGSLAAIPGVGHAAGNKHFTSKACAYSLQYPSGWRASQSGTTATFTNRSSATKYAAVAIVCTRTGVTATALEASEQRTYRKSGWTVGKAVHVRGFYIWTGHKAFRGSTPYTADIELTIGAHHNRGYAFLYSADSHSFQGSLSIYSHILDSIKTK